MINKLSLHFFLSKVHLHSMIKVSYIKLVQKYVILLPDMKYIISFLTKNDILFSLFYTEVSFHISKEYIISFSYIFITFSITVI